jgi:hypothetical protein
MFMNAENLFSPGQKFYGSEYTQEQYNAKVSWIGTMVADQQVHVCAFSEIGEDAETCIRDVIHEVNKHDDTGWPSFEYDEAQYFLADPSKYGAKIRVAVISRFPLIDKIGLTTYPDAFRVDLHKLGTDEAGESNWLTVPLTEYSRPIGKVTVNPPNQATPFNVFVVHLKSKRPSKAKHDGYNEAIGIARAAIRRNVEAAALRYYLDTFLPDQYVRDDKVPSILVGDFNDVPNSVPLENIRGPFDKNPGPGSTWSEPDTRRILSCARLHMKKIAYEDKLYSYVHNENFALLDQAFITEHLPGKFRRMEVYNDHVFRHQDIAAETDEAKQWKSTVSDHGIIVLEFTRMLKP